MNVACVLCLSFFVADGWESVNIVDTVWKSDVEFNCMLRWIMKLNDRRGCFFLKCYSVRHQDGVNIVAVGLARFSYLRFGENGIVYDLIDLFSGFLFFVFLR